MQLTVVERAFRVLKSELLLRPIWHHYSHRAEAHVFVCVLAYALWKTLDRVAKRAGLMTLIRKSDETNPEFAGGKKEVMAVSPENWGLEGECMSCKLPGAQSPRI